MAFVKNGDVQWCDRWERQAEAKQKDQGLVLVTDALFRNHLPQMCPGSHRWL